MATKKITAQRFRRDLSAAELRAALDYNPNTGEFFTKPRKVGSVHRFGRHGEYPAVVITLRPRNGTHAKFYAHRLAYLWMTGDWPDHEIDHWNGDSTDNRWANLRPATRSQNVRNIGASNRNTSGLIGAFYDKAIKRWRSYIAGRYLGIFDTKEQAHEAYKVAALELYGAFVHQSLKPIAPQRRMEIGASSARLPRRRRAVPSDKVF